MAFNQLRQWVQGYGAATGRSTQAMEDAPGVLLEREPQADAAAWVAVEWDATAHAVQVYGHPGRASMFRHGLGLVGGANGDGSDDEDEDADPDGAALDAARVEPVDLSAGGTECRGLHLDPDTGLLTLSLTVPFAALSAPAFEALMDGFMDDMGLWALVLADGGLIGASS